MPAIDPTFAVSTGVVQTQWLAASTANAPNALIVKNNAATRASIAVVGTFGGATVALQGSNDGTNYFPLKDLSNTAISFTAAGLTEFGTAALYIKPVITGGAGDSLNVTVVMRGNPR